jgi:hypothetical protein
MKRLKGETIKTFNEKWSEKYILMMVNDQIT